MNTGELNGSIGSIALDATIAIPSVSGNIPGTKGDKGGKGDKGDIGPSGTSPTINIGNVVTGESGSTASVTNSGTQENVILDFSIPKGDSGVKGDKGDKGDIGAQGYSIGAINKTSGTGQSGTIDEYAVHLNDANNTQVGTFQVKNGNDGTGDGDMSKSTYDVNNNGIVDNADKVNNHTVESDVPTNAKFTDTIYDDTIINAEIAKKANTDTLSSVATSGKYNDLIDAPITTLVGTQANPIILYNIADGLYFIPNGNYFKYFMGDTASTSYGLLMYKSHSGEIIITNIFKKDTIEINCAYPNNDSDKTDSISNSFLNYNGLTCENVYFKNSDGTTTALMVDV